MKYILLALLLISVAACKKDETATPSNANMYRWDCYQMVDASGTLNFTMDTVTVAIGPAESGRAHFNNWSEVCRDLNAALLAKGIDTLVWGPNQFLYCPQNIGSLTVTNKVGLRIRKIDPSPYQ